MKENTVYHNNFLNNTLPDKSVQLIIADPPYYKVKGDFDFIWKSFDDYLEDVEKWAIECKRLLADNGTLFWYGDSKNIAYSQIIFDKYFKLLSNIVCHVYDRQTNKIPVEEARSFINTTERILMYEVNYTENIRKYIRDEIIKSKGKIIFKEINNALGTATNGGGVASACLSLNKKESMMFTKELYIKLQEYCHPFLKKDYEYLSRVFKPNEHYKMDVLRISQEGHISGNYEHDTVKPEKLTRILIQTCSRKNDLVLVPFAGSGTECAMSIKEGRRFIGFDIEEKYVKMANERVNVIKSNPTLF